MSESHRAAFEWGLASVAVGGIATVAAIPAFTAGFEPIARGYWDTIAEGYATLALLSPPALMNVAGLAAVASGIRSGLLARRSGHPGALAVAGVLLGVMAIVLWSEVACGWYLINDAHFGAGV